MKQWMIPFLVAMMGMAMGSAARADGAVVASIKPLHSLVAAVMEGDSNQPFLLVDGKASVHNFALRPSQVNELQKAAVVFYIGDDFELFMQKTLRSLPDSVARVPMDKLQGISRINVRMVGDADADEHRHGPYDLHLWMSPSYADVMVMEIVRQLAIAFPAKKELYFANARKIGLRLDMLDKDLQERMGKVYNKPFIEFHDATQYFDTAYGMRFIGSITVHPERGISAKRVSNLRDLIKKSGVVCVFREPQFDGKVVDNLLAGTNAKSGVLDAEGALLKPGPELYFQLIEGVASAFESCLAS